MRIVIAGTAPEAVMTARALIDRGHEVVIIESERETIDELSEGLDCSFLHGDATNPSVLKETDPEDVDVLFCITDHDQTNILATLVAQSLGFERVITSIDDTDFEEICGELGLEEPIVPARTISRYLADLVEGLDVLELRTIVRGEARFFSFVATSDDRGAVEDLELPREARVICLYRQGEFRLTDEETEIKTDDEVVILTHSKNLSELRDRWQPQVADDA